MKMPRLTIAWIMSSVVVAAINLAAIRALDGTSTLVGWLFVLGAMPMASILVLGIPSLVRGFSGRGKIRPFLIGFEAVGWTVLLIYTSTAVLFPVSVGRVVEWVVNSVFIFFGIDFGSVRGLDAALELFVLFLFLLIPLVPQLAIALVGGWLNQRFKFRITIEPRRTAGVETVS
jgi:hypothetical protein